MKSITLKIATVEKEEIKEIKIHGQLPRKKIKAFSRSGTHTRLTNKQMTKRKRQLKRTQRQRIQAR